MYLFLAIKIVKIIKIINKFITGLIGNMLRITIIVLYFFSFESKEVLFK